MAIRGWLAAACVLAGLAARGAEDGGDLRLTLRSRAEVKPGSGVWEVVERPAAWKASETALILCDVWDKHWCAGANRRAEPIARRADLLAKAMRARGGLIVHAPSGTMKAYEETPQRRRAVEAPKAEPPVPIKGWCHLDEKVEGKLPIDDSDGGCDDEPQCKQGSAWRRQHPAIAIDEADALSDSGQEIFNLLRQRGVKHVIICGVHTNMCILGRPFGIRQLTRLGFDVALARDLTDTMYNSRKAPFVPHERGTDLVVEHVERHWCPTILSSDILGDARPPTVVFAIAEPEYGAKETLPAFAKAALEPLGIRCVMLHGDAKRSDLPGTEKLAEADVLVLFLRRQTLPEEQLARFKAHLDAGKPVIALRTSSHGFQNHLAFDGEVLGGNYKGHHGKDQSPKVTVAAGEIAVIHPLLRGVEAFTSAGSLYKTSPLAKDATPLLTGAIPGQPAEPVAWFRTHRGGKVFYTSLGHAKDFDEPAFRALLTNAVLWSLERPILSKGR